MTLEQMQHWFLVVPALAAAAWNTFTAILTAIIGWLPDERWARMIEHEPRLAGLVQCIRTSGTDTAGFVRGVRLFLTRRPPPPNWPRGLGSKAPGGDGPSVPPVLKMVCAVVLVGALAVGEAVSLSGCKEWLATHEQQIEHVEHDLVLDAALIPCLVEFAAEGPIGAAIQCKVPSALWTLVRDWFAGKAVAIRSASGHVGTLRWVRPEPVDSGADAR